MTKQDFTYLIKELKEGGYHLWFSAAGGWVFVSYKQNRIKLTIGMTTQEATNALFGLRPVK